MRIVACIGFLLTAIPLSAHAEWPMARHDAQRTGASTKPLDLAKPIVSWRTYLGGTLASSQVAALDIDGQPGSEVVLISGGKLVAKQPDDTVLWETAPLALDVIEQIGDFDGDGDTDIIATGAAAFLGIFSAKTGALLWRVREGTYGTFIGAVRLADFNSDGQLDVYAADLGCGSVNGKPVAVAYNFKGGYRTDDGSQRLWQLPANRNYYCGTSDVVADLDHDGSLEVVAFSINTAYVYDGATGEALPASASSPGYALGYTVPYGQLQSTLAGVDGDGSLTIFAATNNNYDPAVNSRALAALSFNRSLPDAQRLSVRWLHNTPDLVNDRHYFAPQLAADLDADGKAEVFTTFLESGALTATIFDGATGATRSTLAGARIVGAVTLASTERPTLLVEHDGKLKGFRFDAPLGIGPAFGTPIFELAVRSVAQVRSQARTQRSNADSAVLTVALPNGRLGLILGRNDTLELWDPSTAAQAPWAPVGSITLPSGVAAVSAAGQSGVSNAGPGWLLARSDGFLIAYDARMQAVNFENGGELALPGIRTGGFYSGSRGEGPVPIAGKLGGAAEELLVTNSVGRLQRLDASRASLVKPPTSVWTVGDFSPLMLDTDGDGTNDLIVAQDNAGVVGRRADASEVFRTTLTQDEFTSAGSLLPLKGSSLQRFALPQFKYGTGQGRTIAFDSTGVKWVSPLIVTAGSGQGQLAADDFDDDGIDEAFGHFQSALRVFNGATGVLMGSSESTYPDSPITVRGRAGSITHIAAGAAVEMQGLSAPKPFTGFVTQWRRSISQEFRHGMAAVAECSNGLAVGNTGNASAHLVIAGVSAGEARINTVLAGGRQFEDDAQAIDAGALRGSLGNVNASGGTSPTMLVGSTDGYLYAVDPCSAPPALRWAVNLRSPVGEAILSDVDGDGADEVVVEAADGFLYGLDQEQFPAPAEVIDTDAARPQLTGDVNETFANAVSAKWAAVPNATGYQYAVFTAGGTALSRNPITPGDPFISVSASTTTASHSDMLKAGAHYFFAVKALGASGASGEVLTNGTRWSPGQLDAGVMMRSDAGPGSDAGTLDGGSLGGKVGGTGSCGCSSDPGVLALLWGVVLVLAGRKATSRRAPRQSLHACHLELTDREDDLRSV